MRQEMIYTDETTIRQRVERRFKERQALWIHFGAFLTANIMLWIFWWLISGESTNAFPWPLIVTACWSIGIVSHFLTYYYRHGSGAERRKAAIEREVEREMERSGAYEKPKNDARLEITDDGEIQEVYDDETLLPGKQKHG